MNERNLPHEVADAINAVSEIMQNSRFEGKQLYSLCIDYAKDIIVDLIHYSFSEKKELKGALTDGENFDAQGLIIKRMGAMYDYQGNVVFPSSRFTGMYVPFYRPVHMKGGFNESEIPPIIIDRLNEEYQQKVIDCVREEDIKKLTPTGKGFVCIQNLSDGGMSMIDIAMVIEQSWRGKDNGT